MAFRLADLGTGAREEDTILVCMFFIALVIVSTEGMELFHEISTKFY